MITIINDRFAEFEKLWLEGLGLKHKEHEQLLEERLSKYESRIYDLELKMDKKTKLLEEATIENKELKIVCNELKKAHQQNIRDHNDLEQHGRRWAVRITGLEAPKKRYL